MSSYCTMEHRVPLHSPGLALQVSNIRQDLGSAHRCYYVFGRIQKRCMKDHESICNMKILKFAGDWRTNPPSFSHLCLYDLH